MRRAAPLRRLAHLRHRTALVLWAEQILPAIAPAFALVLLWLALGLFGAFAPLPGLARPFLAGIVTLVALTVAITALRRVAPPSPASIDHRLERRDWLRPLTTLADRPANPGTADPGTANPDTANLWAAHQARALARVSGLRPGAPSLTPQTQGLLGLPLLLACLAFALALPHPGARLRAALRPAPTPSAVSLQAWIVPPTALGLPSIFLDPVGAKTPILVPRQSRLSLAVHGGTSQRRFHFAGHAHELSRLDRTDFQATLTLTQSGTLTFGRATWPLHVVSPAPPVISFGAAQPVRHGNQLFLPWRATDRFALSAVGVEIRRQDQPNLPPLRLAFPLAGRPPTTSGQNLPDLTANPWAGLPVLLRFYATNTAGLTGHSTTLHTTLPERHFRNLIARVLAEQRKALVLDPTATATAHANLDRLSEAAAGQIGLGAWLDMRVIAAMLADPHANLPAIQNQLWHLALAIEDSGVRAAREALDAARARLNDALSANRNANPSLQQNSQALQQALKNYLKALARQADQNGQTLPRQDTGQTIDPAQLEQMARQAAAAARAGRNQEARRDLARLGNILDHLRPGTPNPDADHQNQKPDALAQSLKSLQAGEQTLHASTANRLTNPAETKAKTTSRAADARTQARLRQHLGDLARKLGERGSPIPRGLATADQAMKNARQALTTGHDKSAEAAERRAIAGLSESGQEMAQQSQGQGQNQGNTQQGQGQGKTTARNPGQGQGQAQGRQGNSHGKDPLGRAWQQGNGALDLGANANATEATIARARALLQEIRRRASDRARPPAELQYLDRLLGN